MAPLLAFHAQRGYRIVLLVLFVLSSVGCANTPSTSVSDLPGGNWQPTSDQPVVVITLDPKESALPSELPNCALESVRAHLPNGPDLDGSMFGGELELWLKESPPSISRERLWEAARKKQVELPRSLDHASHLLVITGKSGPHTHGTLDGIGLVVTVKSPQQTRLYVTAYELADGKLIDTLIVTSAGNSYYGIAGVFPIAVYSDTAGAACHMLSEELADKLSGK